jgi:S1-C subfamily serine protease
MLRTTRILIAVMSIASLLGLTGCGLDLATRAAIEVGGQLVLAGIDAATSNSGAPDVEAYCWDPDKQSASTSTSPNCWSPQVKITEDEYEKFKETGVPPVLNATLAAAAKTSNHYCVNPQGTYFYTLSSTSYCAAGDSDIPEDEWRRRQAEASARSQAAASASVYCWDSEKALEYQLAGHQSCGNDRRITEEQYKTQRARREQAKAEQQAQAERSTESPPPSAQQSRPTETPKPAPVVEAPVVQEAPQASIAPQQINLDRFEATASGTGFFVSSLGHVLTNHHVTAECDAVAGITPVGIYEALMVDSHPKFDLAVLKMPVTSERFAMFSAAAPEQGDDVYVIGFPLLGDFREIKITDGIVSGLSGPDHDTSLIQMTAAVQPGNSGGPLVSQAGLIVGVVVGKYTGEIGGGFYAEGINFAVAHEAAATFLKSNGIEVKRSASAKEMKNRDLMKRAEQWTIPLLCMKGKANS